MEKKEFIKRAKEKFGDLFNYDQIPDRIDTEVSNSEVIICSKHGSFKMAPRVHYRSKHGCPHCAIEAVTTNDQQHNRRFIEKARIKFKDKFDYSKVDLDADKNSKVLIKCPEHGYFKSMIKKHYHTKYGCMGCGVKYSAEAMRRYRTLEDVTLAAKKVHGDKYKYIDFDVKRGTVRYSCPRHGLKTQQLRLHLFKHGCGECRYADRTITKEEFLKKAKEVHPKGYSYDLSELRTTNHKITITHECGHVYKGRVSNHLYGQGCIRCKSSLGEKKIENFLAFNDIEFVAQYSPDGFRYRYDFYLPKLKILIEYDGEQHFRSVEYFGGVEAFEDLKRRDKEKNHIAKTNNLHLIRIPYTKFDFIEAYLSRAIDRRFKYRVDGVFYKSIPELFDAHSFPKGTTTKELEHLRTFRALSPPNQ